MNTNDIQQANERCLDHGPNPSEINVRPVYKGLYDVAISRCPVFVMFTDGTCPIAHSFIHDMVPNQTELLVWTMACRSATTAIDVGAGIGLFTMIAASILQKIGMIFSFEPNASKLERLLINRNLNEFENVVDHAYALARINGRGMILPNLVSNIDGVEMFETDLRSFDSVYGDTEFGKRPVVRIGSSTNCMDILVGMTQFILEYKPQIILPPLNKQQANEITTVLKSEGYSFWEIKNGRQTWMDRISILKETENPQYTAPISSFNSLGWDK